MPKCDFNKVEKPALESLFSKETPTQVCNFIEIALWHGRSPINLLHIFRTPFTKNAFGRLVLNVYSAEKKIIISIRLSRLELKADDTISSWNWPAGLGS